MICVWSLKILSLLMNGWALRGVNTVKPRLLTYEETLEEIDSLTMCFCCLVFYDDPQQILAV
jgi:hypothetical protein